MGINTEIEWCDSTCNPTPTCGGCELWTPDLESRGEAHCYAAKLVKRYAGNSGWPKRFNEFALFPERIEKSAAWPDLTGTDRPGKPWLNGYPRVIFLNDLGDSFSPIAPEDWLDPYIKIMEDSPHIWIHLTKKPDNMLKFFKALGYVPRNFWLMTTITTEATAWRVKPLLQCGELSPHTTIGLSIEPQLEFIDPIGIGAMLNGAYRSVNWVVFGGESGVNARPFHIDWVINATHEYQLDFTYFVKQIGDNPWYKGEKFPHNSPKGKDWTEWPESIRVREMPSCSWIKPL